MKDSRYAVRPARVVDADEVGRVHVQVWREAYAGHMPSDYLEGLDPMKSAARWKLRFEMDEPDGIVVVSTELDGEITGLASAGPTRDIDSPTPWELYSINVLAAHQGIKVELDINILELRQGGVGQRVEGLTGRVRNQVDMKFFLHRLSRLLHAHSEDPSFFPPPRHQHRPRAGQLCMTGG